MAGASAHRHRRIGHRTGHSVHGAGGGAVGPASPGFGAPASNAELLVRHSAVLFELAERYRVLARLDTAPRRAPDEHEAIMRAVIDRHADLAVSLMNTHFQRTADAVERVVFHS